MLSSRFYVLGGFQLDWKRLICQKYDTRYALKIKTDAAASVKECG